MSIQPIISYPIVEIFDSVQGEGIFLGRPATFIRFSGCNLRCSWCDTKNSWIDAPEQSLTEILSQVHHQLVILTGGEPTLYDLIPLIETLHQYNHEVAIETNGTKPTPSTIDWVTCSPKPDNKYEIHCIPNELKYVVDDTFSIEIIPEKYHGKIPIWLQPNGMDREKSLKKAQKIVQSYEYLRLGVQLHKIYEMQ